MITFQNAPIIPKTPFPSRGIDNIDVYITSLSPPNHPVIHLLHSSPEPPCSLLIIPFILILPRRRSRSLEPNRRSNRLRSSGLLSSPDSLRPCIPRGRAGILDGDGLCRGFLTTLFGADSVSIFISYQHTDVTRTGIDSTVEHCGYGGGRIR